MNEIYINGRFLTQGLSGVQRFAYEIVKALSKINVITLLLPKNSRVKDCYNLEFKVKRIGINSGHFWEQFDLPFFLSSIKNPLLICLTNSGPIFYKNKIVTVHDLSFYSNKWFNSTYSTYYKFITPKIIFNSHKVLTVSEFSKNEIINRFQISNKRVEVIYNASNIKKSKKSRKISSKYLLYVGTLSKRKNLAILLNSLELLDSDLELVIVGKIDKNIKDEKIYKNQRIHLINDASNADLSNYYSYAEALIFPSFYEGFGIPPLEALKCGCPVIASNILVLKELYEDVIIYFNPYDEKELTEKIKFLMNNDKIKQKMINDSFKIINKFSWDDSAAKINHLIKDLI